MLNYTSGKQSTKSRKWDYLQDKIPVPSVRKRKIKNELLIHTTTWNDAQQPQYAIQKVEYYVIPFI